jgi:hypothetical protein
LSKALPTVGLAPQPLVVSLSPHLVETHSSCRAQASRCRGDAVHDLVRPAVLDADHHHRGDVRVAAGADQRAEVQFEVGAELQPAVGVRDRHRALDVVRDGLGRGIGQVVQRQHDDVVAHADAAVLAPVAEEGGVLADHAVPLRVARRLTSVSS